MQGKGFYLVLAACVAAVGIAAWSAAATISSVEEDINSSYISSPQPTPSEVENPSSKPQSTEQTGQNVSDVEDTRNDASSTPPSASENTVSVPKGSFTMPINGSIGKSYSDTKLQYSATYGDMRLHLGIDVQADEGTEVLSATKGTVKDVRDDAIWGKTVVMDHGLGFIVNYCGLKNVTVTKGETIPSGTKIGEVGIVPCESADKSHIHVSFMQGDKYVSPYDLLAMKK